MGIQQGKCQRWNRNLCTRAHISASAFGSSCMGLRSACWSWCLRKYCRKWILITLLCCDTGTEVLPVCYGRKRATREWTGKRRRSTCPLMEDFSILWSLPQTWWHRTWGVYSSCCHHCSCVSYCFFFPVTSPLMTLPWLRALVPMWEGFSIVLPHLDYFLDCSFFICFHLLKDLLENLWVCIQLLDSSHTLCILPLDWVLPLETGPWCPSSVWVWNRRCLWLQNSKFNFNLFNILIFKKVLICQKKRQSLWKIKLKIFVVQFPYRRMCLVVKTATYLCECF